MTKYLLFLFALSCEPEEGRKCWQQYKEDGRPVYFKSLENCREMEWFQESRLAVEGFCLGIEKSGMQETADSVHVPLEQSGS